MTVIPGGEDASYLGWREFRNGTLHLFRMLNALSEVKYYMLGSVVAEHKRLENDAYQPSPPFAFSPLLPNACLLCMRFAKTKQQTNFQHDFVATEGFRRIVDASELEQREMRLLRAGGYLRSDSQQSPVSQLDKKKMFFARRKGQSACGVFFGCEKKSSGSRHWKVGPIS